MEIFPFTHPPPKKNDKPCKDVINNVPIISFINLKI